jgi:magnesium chelatase family protein
MPAKPLIVAAMNPCPCGYQGQSRRVCRCTPEQVHRYRARVSGPLMDRFDLHVALPPLAVHEIEDAEPGDDSATVQARVVGSRLRRQERERAERACEPERRSPLLRLAAELEPAALRFLHRGMLQLELSLRAYAKVLRVSRTIADLEASERVRVPHVAEAIQYRLFDREASRQNAPRPRLSAATPFR